MRDWLFVQLGGFDVPPDMKEHEFMYVDSFCPIIRALRERDRCTMRFNANLGWELWFRVRDRRGGESSTSILVDPHASESHGILHSIRYIDRGEWLVWPPVDVEWWEGVMIVVGMKVRPPWQG